MYIKELISCLAMSLKILIDPASVCSNGKQIDCIQKILFLTKSKIDNNRAKWDSMKRSANPFEAISQHNMIDLQGSRPVSRSFFKMWEMLHEFPELLEMLNERAVCVAEGPGGFVQAILKARPCHVDVITLASRHSPCMRVYDKRVKAYTIDGSGDICKLQVAKAFSRIVDGTALFTADGGFDVNGKFDEQAASKK